MTTDTIIDGSDLGHAAITEDMKVDIRRYCGYPAYGYGATGFWQLGYFLIEYQGLELRMNSLTNSEFIRITSYYLPNLADLEDDLMGMREAMIVDQAAVFKRNMNERSDRHGEFTWWRKHLCAFLGIKPGPNFNGSGGVNSVRMTV